MNYVIMHNWVKWTRASKSQILNSLPALDLSFVEQFEG